MTQKLFIALCLFIPAYAVETAQHSPNKPKANGEFHSSTAPIEIPKGKYDPTTGATYYYGSSPRVTATPPQGGTPARTPGSTPPDDRALEAMKAALLAAAIRAQNEN